MSTKAKAQTETAEPGREYRVNMAEMSKRLGGCHRTTVLRKERLGLIPKRRLFPDGEMAWLGSDVDRWFASATTGEDETARRSQLADRLSRH